MQHLVTSQEMARLDRKTIDGLGVPGRVLMENAGRAVAAFCQRRLAPGERVAVVCGTGNNGGDGFVVARILAAAGHTVAVHVAGVRARIRGDALAALEALEQAGGAWSLCFGLEGLAARLAEATLVVDALLGTGARSEVRAIVADAIAAIRGAARFVVAVDLPSGIDGDTGAILGNAVRADATVTFAFPKRGHYLHPGASHCGELHVVDIGIPHALADQEGIQTFVLREEDGPSLLPARDADSHKGTYGHLLVAAGSASRPGAAILALRGALRGGAGLVSWSADTETRAAAPMFPPEAMLHAPGAPLPESVTAIMAGPGWGADEHLEELARLGAAGRPMCLDADALNALSVHANLWSRLLRPLVVTPHPKEMARLSGASVGEIQADRLAAARALATQRDCTVVLKGAATVVAEPNGRAAIVGAGCAALATGGTGDVLAGLIGALLAQGLAPFAAASLGALAHALAGEVCRERFGMVGTTAGDVVEALGTVWARWRR